ncbi:MAG TPA: DNA-3-methyladenine glycosylase [Cellulomonas sp.]
MRTQPAGDALPADAALPTGMVPARVWFARPVLAVAADLLGAHLTVRSAQGDVTVRITEVEAYGGTDDPGSHAHRGRTARNSAMFAEPGRLYVYRHLGLHHCLNVVTAPAGEASAVLLRAGEVVEGAALARARREQVGVVETERQIARGPARLAVALGLDVEANGADLTEAGGRIVLHRDLDARVPAHASGPRVGVGGTGGDAGRFPWRFWLTGEPTVSAYRPAYRRPASGSSPQGGATSA